ncbi:MAG: hypothetical protein EVB11_12790 [Winogradskyella sp.]|nr:MAG: hypothetical protein EVB11_12790 [Winogradskyella sp.]
MKNKLLLIALLLFSISYSQINFEPGFIIDKSGKKIECLIKNLDWSNNPKTIDYKVNENSETITISPQLIKVFQIGDKIRYISETINVDQSSQQFSSLSNFVEPNFTIQTLFIRQLVSGAANLYMYSDNNKSLFFYSLNEGQVFPLVYKKYFKNNQTVAENNSYKKTLYDNFKCKEFNPNKIRGVDYSENDLINFFSDFNFCNTESNLIYKKEGAKGRINLSAKLGVSFSNLEIDFDPGLIGSDIQSASFSNEVTLRFGAEFEYILPFNKNKWAVFIEPSFLSYSSTADIRVQRTSTVFEDTVSIDYKVIEIPIGLRHYFYLNNKSKLFINAAFVVSNDLSDSIEYGISPDLDVRSGTSGLIGLGFNYNNKFSVEARLYFPRDITSTYPFFNSPLSISSIILGYQFL